jgi:hypothetical protein
LGGRASNVEPEVTGSYNQGLRRIIPKPMVENVQNDEGAEPPPPSPERVARRALALGAVTTRAFIEKHDLSDPETEATRKQLLEWVATLEIGEELEPDEWNVLQRPVGRLEQQAVIDSTWRVEGLGVLAWALGRFDLPAYDEEVEPQSLLDAIGVLKERTARALRDAPKVRDLDELEILYWQLVAVHWRLRDYTLRPQAVDFEGLPEKGGWFGGFDLSSCRLIDRDLALGDVAIKDAPEDVFQTALSIANERHMAVNWLLGDAEIYSETDTST